jgi:ribosomal protein L9
VDRKRIDLADPIREIGLFNVNVRLHRDVSAMVRVFVTRA